MAIGKNIFKKMAPQIFFISGCNGTGKTSFINSTFSGNLPKIDPDLIKKENNFSEIESGKIAIDITNYYLKNKLPLFVNQL